MVSVQPDSTLNAMRLKVRRLVVAPSESQLTTYAIDQALNTYITQDFPYAIKLDQMRDVYTFYTSPNVDKYPLDVNYNQGVRSPVYFDGVQGFFSKDRKEFYQTWPRWPTINNMGVPTVNPQLLQYTISQTPFLSTDVTIGGTDTSGKAIIVSDDGFGNLFYRLPNAIVPNPSLPNPMPGMTNMNLSGTQPFMGNTYQTYPGDLISTFVGTVNYVTGVFDYNLALANVTPQAGTLIWTKVSQYVAGRPYNLLFWNNSFEIRPVPNGTYKVEVETYLSPVQMLLITDVPILNQWWQYISYGAAMEILRERQDYEGVENLREGFMRQEGLVLERQGVEEIGQRNATIFSSTTPEQGWNQGSGWPY